MRGWAVAFAVVLALALQTSLLDRATVWGVRPDIVLIVVCIAALRLGPVRGAGIGMAAGFLADLAGGRLIGLGAMAKAIAGLAVGWVGRRLFSENVVVSVAVVAGASAIEHAVYLVGAWVLGLSFPFSERVLAVALPGLWYDAAAAVGVYPIYLLLRRCLARGGAATRSGFDNR